MRIVHPILACLLLALQLSISHAAPGGATPPASGSNGVRNQPGVVVVKFSSSVRTALSKSAVDLPQLSQALAKYGVTGVNQMYPNHAASFAPDGTEIGIDRMYRITYTENTDPLVVAREIAAMPGVVYAEPERIFPVAFVPNDPRLAQQYAVDAMHLKEAWDITTGSKDVVIGIVDSGVAWQHEDIRANIRINPGEDVNHDGQYTLADINGIDDDGNGYVDDIIGIDFVGPTSSGNSTYYDNDPQPTATGNDHGTHVAGISAAVGNNTHGIAGVAFSCSILPVKCGSDDGGSSIIRGYDGIMYAADNGARVINCSWGGKGGWLQSEQDRITYALSKGAVIVAAAGNDGQDAVFTPASYKGVLSVASTRNLDRVSTFSNYGTWVDVSAPGENILSSVSSSTNAYAYYSGTSMASPQVTGVVALVASKFPKYTAEQLAELVRITANPIDSINSTRYAHKIGYGRVNAFRALTLSMPAVRLVDWHLNDTLAGNSNGIIDRGEKVHIVMTWKNFLNPTKNATVHLSTSNALVTISNPDFTIGALGTGETVSNESAPFELQIADSEALNDVIALNYTITDDEYSDYGGIEILQQPTYRDHNANSVVTTISNDGNIGFDDFTGQRGSGFIFQNNTYNVLFEGALMIGAKVRGVKKVVDVARNETGSMQCTDFIGTKSVVMTSPGAIAAQEGFTEFTDASAPAANKLGVKVTLHSFEFTEKDQKNMVILHYTIENTGTDTLASTYAGLYFDWDIGKSAYSDYSDFDTTTQTGYAYSRAGDVPTWVGVTSLVRTKPTQFVSLNNPDADNPPIIGIHNGFSKDEKYRSISSGILVRQSKITDISQVIGSGPWTLTPGGKADVGFALMAGLSKNDILKSTPFALDAWSRIMQPTAVETPAVPGVLAISAYPNPASIARGGSVQLSWSQERAGWAQVTVHDVLGRVVAHSAASRSAGVQTLGLSVSSLAPGIYFARLQTGDAAAVTRIVLQR